MTAPCGIMQRRFPFLILMLHMNSFGEQKDDDLVLAAFCCLVDGGHSITRVSLAQRSLFFLPYELAIRRLLPRCERSFVAPENWITLKGSFQKGYEKSFMSHFRSNEKVRPPITFRANFLNILRQRKQWERSDILGYVTASREF